MRGNHSAEEEEKHGGGKKERKSREEWRDGEIEGVERKKGEEETVIISSPSCESQPVSHSLRGKLEKHTDCLRSESLSPDSPVKTTQRLSFCDL